MTAYGALISLQNTVHQIIHSSHIILAKNSLYLMQRAYEELQPFQEILESLDDTSKRRSRKKVSVLDKRIKEKLRGFEDWLEYVVSQQILAQLETPARNVFSIDLQCLYDDVRALFRMRKVMEKEYVYELRNMVEDEGPISSFGGTKSKMMGLHDQLEQVKNDLDDSFDKKLVVCALVGMGGVGKTTLANEIFEDPWILSRYERRAWVTVSRKPQKIGELLRGIVAQLIEGDKEMDDREIILELEGKKCLIVLDDVWETKILSSLISSLPSVGNILILVTARERDVIENITSERSGLTITVVRFLNEEESKDLLCHKVFGDEICPSRLDKAATKIAKKCEGLPLVIVTVADILSKSHIKDPNYWDDVAEGRNSVFTDAYDQISKVLFPSYDYLPQYLKMPFLFMGVCSPHNDLPPSKLISMFSSEGWFLHANEIRSFEVSVWHCLEKLRFNKNLLLLNRKSISRHAKTEGRKYKSCRLHSAWWQLCRREGRKSKFYHVLSRLSDASKTYVKGQRCLCLQNNILFGFKGFRKSVRLNCASTTRSLLFFGPYHQYPTPIDVGFRLLRELDALKLRFYTFPTEILTLVQLKFLALTCNGELPAAISKLFNLRVLIIHPHISITCFRAPSCIPIQIWNMEELEHIEILGKSLVAPRRFASLGKLSTLLGVNATSICNILDLSGRIPNIKKLAFQIELMPYDDHNDLLSRFSCISTLESLETLKCSTISPVAHHSYDTPATPSSLKLPCYLKKLHLSGTGFPWEYMDVIGSLPLLKVLKLHSYAFRGSQWEAQKDSFSTLEFLLIEDSDLVQWIPRNGSFPKLSCLSMKHCYKLVEIHWSSLSNLGKIELVDCNPLALNFSSQLEPSPCAHLDGTATSYFDETPVTVELRSHEGPMPRQWVDAPSEPVFIAEPEQSYTTFSTPLFMVSVILLLGCLLKLGMLT
ncbi:putative late blight resistance protein R1A-10 isoform X1 [Salvia divinorum]|uniref:Late blight resistance protein R1A-10 isoform X1 n=1 Tax=Salvia divinorum TaxID=28513 RepID=A0ABD1GEH8_SALDI